MKKASEFLKKVNFSNYYLDIFFLFALVILSLIPIYNHLHLVEQDFIEILNSADGFYKGQGYCFLNVNKVFGEIHILGNTGRPPLIPILLSGTFHLFGHNLFSIYLTYLLPRLIILPAAYLLARQYFQPVTSYLSATLILFVPFLETYALSTLKADVFVVAFSLISVLFAKAWMVTNKRQFLLLAGLFISFNILSKETASSFSLILLLIIMFKIIIQKKDYFKNLLPLLSPLVFLVTPFILFSFFKTGKISTNLYASYLSINSLPENLRTYFLTIPFYLGIQFNLSKLLTFFSLIKLIVLLSGLLYITYKRHFELFLPAIIFLIGISIHPTLMIQGNSIGDREIIHRLAPLIPFVTLYLVFGLNLISSLITIFSRNLNLVIGLVLINIIFIFLYFRAPYSLDYTDNEFYINFPILFNDRIEIPISNFRFESGVCITKDDSMAEVYLLNYYRNYKVSAFPPLYKEKIITSWLAILLIGLIISLKNLRTFKKKSS